MKDPQQDPLEAELYALQPQPLSGDFVPRLQRSLAAGPPQSPHRMGWVLATVTALAACILLAIFAMHIAHRSPELNRQANSRPSSSPWYEPAGPLPTLAEYQHAVAESPEVLDALMDRHRAEQFVTGARVPRAGDLLRAYSESEFK
jgi:hypothetical protein